MDQLIPEEVNEHYYAPIHKVFNCYDIIEGLFPDKKDQDLFIECLVELNALGSEIKLGGRTIRELLGCKITDYTSGISKEKYTELEVKELGPLVEILRQYPEERMLKPDLDFFISNSDLKTVAEVFSIKGFQVNFHFASGGIQVIDISSKFGTISFVDEESWQLSDEARWPKLAIKAFFRPGNPSQFEINSWNGSLFLYPLFLRGYENHGPLEPRLFATISRSLLWFATVQDPEGRCLQINDLQTQDLIVRSVHYAYRLVTRENLTPLPLEYRGSLRDFALAMRVILLTDWEKMVEDGHYPITNLKFIERVKKAWPPANRIE